MVVVRVVVTEVRVMVATREWVVGRHRPIEVGRGHRGAEAQILCRAIYTAAVVVVEPDACQVDGIVNLLARVGIIAIQPNLVVFAVHRLIPHFIDNHIRSQLVGIAAINHQLRLPVESRGHADSLRSGEEAHLVGGDRQGCHQQRDCQNQFFHCFTLSFFYVAAGIAATVVLFLSICISTFKKLAPFNYF